jgi:hypothetical protein
MANLQWDGDDFRNSQDSSGSTADLVSHSGELQQGYKHGSLTDGLVAYYPMEKGEGGVLHDAALNNTGQINGATWNGPGQVGSDALRFDGSDDLVKIQHNNVFNPSGPFSVSLWAKRTNYSGNKTNETLFSKDYDGSKTPWQTWWNNGDGSGGDGLPAFRVETDTSVQFVEFNNRPSEGVWVHLTAVYDSNQTLKIYRDGILQNSTSISGNLTSTTTNQYIGHSSQFDNYFEGSVEDVRYYDRALSKPEIQALYNLSQPSGIEKTEEDVPSQNQGGISRWKFNGDVTDTWGSNDGTNNGVTFGDGVYGQSAIFESTNSDYISVPSDAALNSESQSTVSGWIKTSSGGSHQQVYSSFDGSNGLQIYVDDDGTAAIWTDTDGTLSSSIVVNDGNWHHLTMTIDGSGRKLYVDGKLTTSDSGSVTESTGQDDIGRQGGGNPSSYFNGKIDDVRIYNTALTPQQVEQLYHKGAYRIPRRSTLQ